MNKQSKTTTWQRSQRYRQLGIRVSQAAEIVSDAEQVAIELLDGAEDEERFDARMTRDAVRRAARQLEWALTRVRVTQDLLQRAYWRNELAWFLTDCNGIDVARQPEMLNNRGLPMDGRGTFQ